MLFIITRLGIYGTGALQIGLLLLVLLLAAADDDAAHHDENMSTLTSSRYIEVIELQ